MAHQFTGWVLDAIAARKVPDRVRSCRVCGRREREGVDGYIGHVPDAERPLLGTLVGRVDYAAIREEANDPDFAAIEVSRDEYYGMLGAVPPLYVRGGFLMGEPVTGDARGEVFMNYARHAGMGNSAEPDRYYGRFAVAGRPETYIA